MKILVIEDSLDDRMHYQRALKKDKLVADEIIETDNGEAGIAEIEKDFPDCVLLDYSLPGRNGIEILKQIRASYPFLPVVMLTGQGSETIAVNAIMEGAQNYITKSSITSESLRRVITIATEHCALQKRIHEQRTALEIFTRALAHDLKEPLRTIRTYLELIYTREKFSDKSADYYKYVQGAAQRMVNLIDSVFLYIKVDSQTDNKEQELCDIGTIVEEAKENVIQLIRERGAIITYDGLPQISGNRMQLLQMFQNFLINSIRHSESATQIHIEVKEEQDHWLFSLSDNGPGIEKKFRDKIFQPFKRFSNVQQQGLGLGLTICKKIIEFHHGKIWYEDSDSGGAKFMFTLPKQMQLSPQNSEFIEQEENAANSRTDGPLANILLVEDNESDIELLKLILIEDENLKFNLVIAHNGYEALDILHSKLETPNPIDLILLDINMPGMNGFELMEKINAEEALNKVPVIMCSTSNYDKDISRAKSLGAVGYVDKPAGLTKLKPAIKKTSNLRLEQINGGYALLRNIA